MADERLSKTLIKRFILDNPTWSVKANATLYKLLGGEQITQKQFDWVLYTFWKKQRSRDLEKEVIDVFGDDIVS